MANDLVTLGGNLESPRNASGKDFPMVGPSGAAGEQSGKDQLVKQTDLQMSPAMATGADFPIQQSKERGTAVKYDCSVDLESGQTVPHVAMYK